MLHDPQVLGTDVCLEPTCRIAQLCDVSKEELLLDLSDRMQLQLLCGRILDGSKETPEIGGYTKRPHLQVLNPTHLPQVSLLNILNLLRLDFRI
jgi:hypothetical protein